jgi:hypothetical protein
MRRCFGFPEPIVTTRGSSHANDETGRLVERQMTGFATCGARPHTAVYQVIRSPMLSAADPCMLPGCAPNVPPSEADPTLVTFDAWTG